MSLLRGKESVGSYDVNGTQASKDGLFPGRYYTQVDSGKLQCNVCPRHCQLKEGVRGFCYVRQRVGDQVVLTTYGRSSGFCIDPIEKKPLNHFLVGTPVLSFGTAGCNLGCKFCQNWDVSKAKALDRLQDEASPDKIAKVAKQLGCESVAFTYNDPVIFLEYAVDIAKSCRELGIKTVAVTAGYITKEARVEFYEGMDAANVDLKAFTQEFYKKTCMSDLQPVLDTLCYLKHETDVWFEITNLVIPDLNDDDREFNEMVDWILDNLGPDVPLHFTAFHPDYRMMDLPPTPPETLKRARKLALSKGLRFVYTGNIMDKEGSSTYCSSCNQMIIGREWYEISDYHISEGRCSFCKTVVPGQFNLEVGTWGRKRLPVQLSTIT